MKNKWILIAPALFVLATSGCDTGHDADKVQAAKEEVAAEAPNEPNEPRDMETIRRETNEYRIMKEAAAREIKADIELMEAEKFSNRAPELE